MATRKPPAGDAATPGTLTALPPAAEVTLERILTDNRSLLDVLNAAVEQMTWLRSTDAAMVKLCQQYAQSIDDAVSIADELEEITPHLQALEDEGVDITALVKRIRAIAATADVIKVIGWIGPHAANTLRDLGGTPAERKGLEADAPVKSRLQAIREGSKDRRPASSP